MLVRENMKAYVSKSDDIETIQEKSRTIAVGEVREVKVSQVANDPPGADPCGGGSWCSGQNPDSVPAMLRSGF